MIPSASRYGQLKSTATVGLVLRSAAERYDWLDYLTRLKEHVLAHYRTELPDVDEMEQYQNHPDSLGELIIDRLGQETAVLSVYKVLEDVINDTSGVKNEEPTPVGGEEETKVRKVPDSPEKTEVPLQSMSPIVSAAGLTNDEVKINMEVESPSDEGYLNPDAGEELHTFAERDASAPASPETAGDCGSSDTATPATTTTTAADDHGEPDEPADPDPDRRNESGDSDHDSGYYSANGGRAATPSSERDQSLLSTDDDDDLRETGNADSDRESSLPRGPALLKCIERQAMILTGALKDASLDSDGKMPLSVETVQAQLERFIFNPDPRLPREQVEARYNFYPPFMIPKAIANYHIFAVTAPIPESCKANRSGTDLYASHCSTKQFKRLPRWKIGVQIDDTLGNDVSPVAELEEESKLIPLHGDTSRLQWAKMRGEHIRYFCYPSLHLPPKISKMLMETLLQPFADEAIRDDYPAPAISDEELAYIIDPEKVMKANALGKAIEARRDMMALAVRYTVQLELMERVLREPSSIKKAQEVLHHTFHHGYVALIRETAKVNLSNYSTFHGQTYNDPLNNCMIAKLLEGLDKRDFVTDSIYLFLVLTWQTAMGMWHQAVAEETLQIYEEVFSRRRRALYALESVTDMSKAIVDILMDGDRLCLEMRKALPNFTNMSQINHFRQFIMERSNIPSIAAPFLPSDFVPLSFKQSQPLLWDQVYLLQIAAFLTNHGGYLWEPVSEEEPNPRDKLYCPCNLCSPHRMPQHNMALHNEMLAINTFEIRSAEGKTFKLTPELWTNAYLDKFEPKDYFPLEVRHYSEGHEDAFQKEMTGCVTKTPEILSLIRQIQSSREEFLLTRGKGVYKDPNTGEVLTPLPDQQAGRQALSTAQPHLPRGTAPATKPSRAIRAPHSEPKFSTLEHHGTVDSAAAEPRSKHGSENGRRESQSGGRARGHDTCCPSGGKSLQPRGGDSFRRRNPRKRRHRNGGGGGGIGSDEYHLGGGGGGGRFEQREQPATPSDPAQEAPKYTILSRRPVSPDPAAAPTRPSTPR